MNEKQLKNKAEEMWKCSSLLSAVNNANHVEDSTAHNVFVTTTLCSGGDFEIPRNKF